MIHLDVKKVGRIPDGGGWRIHGRDSGQAKAVKRARVTRKKNGKRAGYVYLHSAIDGYSRLAYTEHLPDEKAATAVGFWARARAWFAAHGITMITRIVTDNGSCYRSDAFATAIQQRLSTPTDPALHPTPQRQSRALPADPGRGSPLRPPLQQRSRASGHDRPLEHPLQLPSTPHRRRRPTTR